MLLAVPAERGHFRRRMLDENKKAAPIDWQNYAAFALPASPSPPPDREAM